MQERWQAVQKRIAEAAAESGRPRQAVRLIAVSKTRPLEAVDELAGLGQLDFGENRVQELQPKSTARPGLNWHMIGRLQTNKVRHIIDKITMLHSLDRWNLALEVEKRAANAGIILPALVQVNISGEASKAGMAPCEVRDFCLEMQELKHISLRGLMTIAPLGTDGPQARPYFRALRELREQLVEDDMLQGKLPHLSMGMSGDYREAILEGSTMIRVGSAIFGPRTR